MQSKFFSIRYTIDLQIEISYIEKGQIAMEFFDRNNFNFVKKIY